MRFAVDAHAIGRHLTGNEVYVRSLLNALAAQNHGDQFIAYVSADSASQSLPRSIITRRIATNPFMRCQSAEIRRSMKLGPDTPDVEVLAALRKAKDTFKAPKAP